jgi:hypothetical protein
LHCCKEPNLILIGNFVAFSIFNSCLQKNPYLQVAKSGEIVCLLDVTMRDADGNIKQTESKGIDLFFKRKLFCILKSIEFWAYKEGVRIKKSTIKPQILFQKNISLHLSANLHL